jgi:hypothetical protein
MSTTLTTQMDKADATALTHRLRTAVEGLRDLLVEAHDRKAWKAMGYATWEAYVKGEIGLSRPRSYQILDEVRVIGAVRDATGDLSNALDISVRDAAAVKDDLPAVTGEIKERIEAGEDPKKAVNETIATKKAEKEKAKAEKKAAKEKAKAEKDAEQAKYDREREEHLAKTPEAIKQHQAAKEAAIAAKKAKAAEVDEGEGLSDADRIEELEEAVRVLEAENAELKAKVEADSALYGEMRRQWEAGGYERVIADKDGVIRVLETRLYTENEDKVSWMRSAKYWKEEAVKLGWSNEAAIDIKTGEVVNG